jgi:5-bromo-4-chloroindolyl phosphate hydrolysis protein
MDVAHYFIIVENTPIGQTHLKRWFRVDRVPEHYVCREAISEWEASINPDHNKADYRYVKDELYHKKSKWIHPTLNSIREMFIFNELNGKLSVNGFNYSTCKYERKLVEYAHFFKSSIWSAYQVFMFCFRNSMPLEQRDIEFILEYDKLFQQLDTIEW